MKNISTINNMMGHNLQKPIPKQSSSRSTSTGLGIGIPGQLVTSGPHDSGLVPEKPGPANVGLLEEKRFIHWKYKRLETKK